MESEIGVIFALGKMAEWSIAAVLKTVELQGSGGSNPSLSATSASERNIALEKAMFFCEKERVGKLFSRNSFLFAKTPVVDFVRGHLRIKEKKGSRSKAT